MRGGAGPKDEKEVEKLKRKKGGGLEGKKGGELEVGGVKSGGGGGSKRIKDESDDNDK